MLKLLSAAAALLISAAPAGAGPILSLTFSGELDLGDGHLNPFSGMVSWDTSQANIGRSAFHDYSIGVDRFTWNAGDVPVVDPYALLRVSDGGLWLGFNFLPAINIAGTSGLIVRFNGSVTTTAGTFSSLAVPDDLDFLASVTRTFSAFDVKGPSGTGFNGLGTLNLNAPAPVPEPASVTLMALGIAGVLAGRRRRRA